MHINNLVEVHYNFWENRSGPLASAPSNLSTASAFMYSSTQLLLYYIPVFSSLTVKRIFSAISVRLLPGSFGHRKPAFREHACNWNKPIFNTILRYKYFIPVPYDLCRYDLVVLEKKEPQAALVFWLSCDWKFYPSRTVVTATLTLY